MNIFSKHVYKSGSQRILLKIVQKLDLQNYEITAEKKGLRTFT